MANSNYNYGTQAMVENMFGVNTVAMWSNPTGYQPGMSANQQVLQMAMNSADAEIAQPFFTYGNFVTPLVPLGASVFAINAIWAAITGDYLRLSRGLSDADVGQYCDRWKKARSQLQTMRTTSGGLNAQRRWPAATCPQAG